MAFLVHGDQRRPLGPGVLSIGSGVEAAWRFRHPELARLHALVTRDPQGRAAVMRATPEAEVRLNDVPIGGDAQRLAPGDRITLADLEFTFATDEPPADAAPTGSGYLRDARRDRIHALQREQVAIGRDPGSDILLQEPEVARVHLRLERDGETIRLVPQLGATTLVNGTRVEKPLVLKDNDAIGIGRTVLFFSHGPPRRHPLENVPMGDTAKYTRRLDSGVLGVVVRREEREELERRRARVAILVAAGLIVAIACGLWLWQSVAVQAGIDRLLQTLG
ncbi:MAG: FHA domain-containing protein [Gemmatimonadaceae bacterium]|jgi:pSer/pThr/pTyr-binding forkhead associated (FHA) protein|nr:FHA domain-containing protein [Gemmatimonadaceae bacterium]